MNAADAEAASTSFVLQRGDDHRTTEPRCRQKSEYQTGQQAKPETERDHRKIHSQQLLELNRNGLSDHPRQRRRDVEEHKRSKSAAETCQQHGFGEKILDQAAAA